MGAVFDGECAYRNIKPDVSGDYDEGNVVVKSMNDKAPVTDSGAFGLKLKEGLSKYRFL